MQFVSKRQYVYMPQWKVNTFYPEGICVKYGSGFYYCEQEHISDTSFRDAYWTQMGGGDAGMPKLSELVQSMNITRGSTASVDLPIDTNKVDIRTVYFAADKSGDLKVDIYDKKVDGFCVYASNVEQEIYDIVNVPYIDKDYTNLLHVVLQNNTGSNIAAILRIKVTSLS